ncbi:uncharacterized protein LOC108697801 [Xenopus laevis]|uniref:Uncharacterized protein LOC108697801 n=1 Tax=Xenopus laevis TaxID=8355 RepID=A0A8J0TDD9_XENLA|nr:uncharacterized protein LOC108697801 [Xenopus laevis]
MATKSSSEPSTDTCRRYMWAGAFSQKITAHGITKTVPICSSCEHELTWAMQDVKACCSHCGRPCFLGPYYMRVTLHPKTEVVSRFRQFQVDDCDLDAELNSEHLFPDELEPGDNLELPEATSEFFSPSGSNSMAEQGEISSAVLCVPRRTPQVDESDFWVLPGVADTKSLGAVSKVQKIISLEIFKQYGYYMPYAPAWVFDEVDARVKDWIHKDILANRKPEKNSAFCSDREKHWWSWERVWEMSIQWWWGQTIMRHAVKSFGEYQPVRYLSIDVVMPNGKEVEKPHPAYYRSLEETKDWLHRLFQTM